MDLTIETLLHLNKVECLVVDAALRITAMSPGAARLAFDPDAAAPGNDIRSGFPEFVGAENMLKEVMDGARPSWHIRGICRSDDPTNPLYLAATVELSRSEKDPGPSLAVMLEDITGWMTTVQKSTQTMNDAMALLQALTASKAYIEGILNAMADILIVTSPEGTISAVNAAALSAFGYTSPELIGQPVAALLPEEEMRRGVMYESAGFVQPRFEKVELHCTTRDGTVFPISFSRAPLESCDGLARGLVYVGRDLREQRRAEDRISKLETENISLHEVLSADLNAAEIVGNSPPMRQLTANLVKVAATDTTVLITGETGTDKELVAKALHQLSPRSKKLLVSVNCAGLPAGLVESELFGHEKGAFTGAIQKRVGRFELADGGTVFLDEVGELPPAAQAMLLRVLQGQEFERVGGSKPVNVDVRVIAATNRDLEAEVRNGRFREDLLFRLDVFPLHVPPLRDRPSDIPLLAEHFVHLFARRMNKNVTGLSPAAVNALARCHWPGNVRELANVIERAMIVCETGMLGEGDLALIKESRERDSAAATFDGLARQHILEALEESNGVIEGSRGAASRLGLNPATLRSKMKKLGISRTKGGFVAQIDALD